MKSLKTTTGQKGFTLVELSIVLVIIGLLIGGILVAESLIGTTKIQTFIGQIQQYDVATNTFYDKFDGLPGDSANMTGAEPGDGDGYVGAANTASLIVSDEVSNFWPHLSLTGLSKQGGGNYTAITAATGVDLEVSVPKAKIGNNLAIIAYGAPDAGSPQGGNYYLVADCTEWSAGAPNCSRGIADADAIATDVKIDDGLGDSGDVLGFNDNIDNLAALADGGNQYLLSAEYEHALVIRIGSRVGDRK